MKKTPYHYTAKELANYFQKLPPNTKIILATDEEGNQYHDMIMMEVYNKHKQNITPKQITHCMISPLGPGHDSLRDL